MRLFPHTFGRKTIVLISSEFRPRQLQAIMATRVVLGSKNEASASPAVVVNPQGGKFAVLPATEMHADRKREAAVCCVVGVCYLP